MKSRHHTSELRGCQERLVRAVHLFALIFSFDGSIIWMGIKEEKFLDRIGAL